MTTPPSDYVRRQIERYEVRFNEAFWAFFDASVRPLLPASPGVVDVACGPGFYLRDLSQRLADARLTGVDNSAEMVEHARALDFVGDAPDIVEQDVERTALPFGDASVDLLSIAAALHTFTNPYPFLDEVKRVLTPGGVFMLYDWMRVPLPDYIDGRLSEPGDPPDQRYARALQQFVIHNKYTSADWDWVLAKAGLAIVDECVPSPHSRARLWLLRAASTPERSRPRPLSEGNDR